MLEVVLQDFKHSALFLVNDVTGRVEDKISFSPIFDGKAKIWILRNDYDHDCRFERNEYQRSYILDDYGYVDDIWEQGKEAGGILSDARIPVSEDETSLYEFNCRSGVIGCLRAMGYDYAHPSGVPNKPGTRFDFSHLKLKLAKT